MAFKQFALDERTQVTIYKRRSSRSLRLSIAADGKVRVSIPTWAPYRAGLEFARSRYAWIEKQRPDETLLCDGQPVGKAHHLKFVVNQAKSKPSSRIKSNEITISYPATMASTDSTVQKIATTACVRALRQQAERLLPQRLSTLASVHSYEFTSVAVKQLKGRWGSCDHNANIVLNLYLMQLPWELIDYVLLHELAHTKVLRHGPDFWREMESALPDVKARRKALREYQPVLYS